MIVFGRLTEAWGIQGWLRLHPFGDDPLSWKQIRAWRLARDDQAADEHWQCHTLSGLREQGGGLVVKFKGIDDRSQAEALAGCYCGALREALPPTAENEFYWADLVGMRVVNRDGDNLGTVSALIDTGAHAVLQIGEGEAQRLIPFVAAYVGEIEREAGIIHVDWGLDW